VVPGSAGRQAAESLGEDEDAEGRSESAQIFAEGISEAEHDHTLRAAEANEQNDEEKLLRSLRLPREKPDQPE